MRVLLAIFLSVALAACGGGSGDGEVDITGGTDDGGTTPPPPGGPTVDQAFDPSANLTVNLPIGDRDYAQTFTVARAGRLESIDLMLSNPSGAVGTIRVDVRGTAAGAPTEDDGVTLATRDLDVSLLSILPAFVRFDLASSNVALLVDDELAIVVRRIDGDPFTGVVHGTTLEPYDRGQAFEREPAAVFVPAFAGDFGFRTRVDAGP